MNTQIEERYGILEISNSTDILNRVHKNCQLSTSILLLNIPLNNRRTKNEDKNYIISFFKPEDVNIMFKYSYNLKEKNNFIKLVLSKMEFVSYDRCQITYNQGCYEYLISFNEGIDINSTECLKEVEYITKAFTIEPTDSMTGIKISFTEFNENYKILTLERHIRYCSCTIS